MGACISKNNRRDIVVPSRSADTTTNSEAKSIIGQDDRKRSELSDNQAGRNSQSSVRQKKLSSNYVAIPNKARKQNPVSKSEYVGGLIGLKNLGNTCFMNSALQCLLHMPPLVDYFLQKLHFNELNMSNPLGSKGIVTLAFARLVKQYWKKSDINEIAAKELYDVIAQAIPRFAQGTQEDCHEFLVSFLDVLHEDLNRVKQKTPFEDAECLEDEKLEECAQESWKNYLTRNKSVIVDLLQGQSKSTLKCLKCGTQSHKFEPFMYLSTPIPDENEYSGKVDLLDCLKEYSKEEKLQQEELWSCPKCKVLVEATKKLEIWKLPNILIVHLKRFRYNKKGKGKITTLVDFPIVDLDLSSIATGTQPDKPIYDLLAVSNHNGTLNRGHYYTFAKNREDNSWYAFNDTEVMTLEPKQLVAPTGYLLFFCKTSTEEFKRQSLSKPENWPHFPKIIEPNGKLLSSVDTRRSSVSSVSGFDQKMGFSHKQSNKLITDSSDARLKSVDKFDTTSVSSAATINYDKKSQKRTFLGQELNSTDQATPDSTSSNFSTDPFFKNMRQPRDKQQDYQVKEKAASIEKSTGKGILKNPSQPHMLNRKGSRATQDSNHLDTQASLPQFDNLYNALDSFSGRTSGDKQLASQRRDEIKNYGINPGAKESYRFSGIQIVDNPSDNGFDHTESQTESERAVKDNAGAYTKQMKITPKTQKGTRPFR